MSAPWLSALLHQLLGPAHAGPLACHPNPHPIEIPTVHHVPRLVQVQHALPDTAHNRLANANPHPSCPHLCATFHALYKSSTSSSHSTQHTSPR